MNRSFNRAPELDDPSSSLSQSVTNQNIKGDVRHIKSLTCRTRMEFDNDNDSFNRRPMSGQSEYKAHRLHDGGAKGLSCDDVGRNYPCAGQ